MSNYIDDYLKSKGSPYAGYGQTFVNAGQKFGVDPRLVVAISGIESSFGKHMKSPWNAWGWNRGDTAFNTPQAAINAVTKGLSSGYIQQGLMTPAQIQPKYAPSFENDGSNWVKTVNQFMGELGGAGSPQAPSSSPAAPPPPSPAPTVSRMVPNLGQSMQDGLLALARGDYNPAQQLRSMSYTKVDVPAGKPIPESGGLRYPQLKATPKTDEEAAIVQEAYKWLGTPYSWAGGGLAGPSKGVGRGANTVGFDCSGFLQYLWGKRGVQIPRVTYDQWKQGTEPDQLEPGDAVFFHMGERGPEHVGMYIGNGRFIHAPKTGDVVKISELKGYKGYVGARRYA